MQKSYGALQDVLENMQHIQIIIMYVNWSLFNLLLICCYDISFMCLVWEMSALFVLNIIIRNVCMFIRHTYAHVYVQYDSP